MQYGLRTRTQGAPVVAARAHRAFTLIELLVVIAIISLLIGILLPALAGARLAGREIKDASQIRQLMLATQMYLDDHRNNLPQLAPDPGPYVVQASINPHLWGGKKGSLPNGSDNGVNSYGAARRPLNEYVMDWQPTADVLPDGTITAPQEIEIFRSPLDIGGDLTSMGINGLERVESMYDTFGSSYAINDHAPDMSASQNPEVTLIPNLIRNDSQWVQGGAMPLVIEPTRTVVIGSQPMYNWEVSDRDMRWHGNRSPRAPVKATMAFLDGHAEAAVKIPEALEPGRLVWSTEDFTFLPSPRRLEQSAIGYAMDR